jgi:hypothetical protein
VPDLPSANIFGQKRACPDNRIPADPNTGHDQSPGPDPAGVPDFRTSQFRFKIPAMTDMVRVDHNRRGPEKTMMANASIFRDMALTLDSRIMPDHRIGFDHHIMPDHRIIPDLNTVSDHTMMPDENPVPDSTSCIDNRVANPNPGTYIGIGVHLVSDRQGFKPPLINVAVFHLSAPFLVGLRNFSYDKRYNPNLAA